MSLLVRGNRKLGRNVWHFDLPAGPDASCPGASSFCAAVCYARNGSFTWPSVQSKYAANLALARNPAASILEMAAELDRLPAGAVVRIHTSGDFFSELYVQAWHTLAETHPAIEFYAYTRSWTLPVLRERLERMERLPNVTLWASHDPSMRPAPSDWRVARIVRDWIEAPGEAHCPEQTGRRPSCSDCGLCWHAKPAARLAFHLH